jgi:hypothetical protein
MPRKVADSLYVLKKWIWMNGAFKKLISRRRGQDINVIFTILRGVGYQDPPKAGALTDTSKQDSIN